MAYSFYLVLWTSFLFLYLLFLSAFAWFSFFIVCVLAWVLAGVIACLCVFWCVVCSGCLLMSVSRMCFFLIVCDWRVIFCFLFGASLCIAECFDF